MDESGHQPLDEMHGALVGWHIVPSGERMVLNIQSVTTPPPHSREDVQIHRFIINRNQAVQLGNYLFEMSGQTPPRRHRKRLLDRLIGG